MVTTKAPTANAAGLKAIDKLIDTARKAITSSREAVQTAAIAIISHAKDHGDCTRAKVLCRAVPSRERNMLIGYFALYSPIGVQMGKTAADDKSRFIRDTAKNYHDFNLDGARANKWYDDPARVAPVAPSLNTLGAFYDNLDKMLKNMIAQAEADDEKNKWKPEVREELKAQASEIRTMVNNYRAKHVAANEASKPPAANAEPMTKAA